LEKKAKRADALEREVAFLKAGVNSDDPRAKWFYKGYDGELTADAIKAAAVEAGLVEAADGASEDIPADERASLERIDAAKVGGQPTGNYDLDAQIAEATAAGNHLRVIALKQERAALNKRD
jgi:hypothetical protein